MRLLEACESTEVVLFWYTELPVVLDRRALEIVDTTLEFAALLVGDTNAA